MQITNSIVGVGQVPVISRKDIKLGNDTLNVSQNPKYIRLETMLHIIQQIIWQQHVDSKLVRRGGQVPVIRRKDITPQEQTSECSTLYKQRF